MSAEQLTAVADSTESMIVTSRANPGIPDATIDQLLDDGIGPLDYGTDESLNSDEIDSANPAGRGAINNLVNISSRGGYGILHKKEFDRVLIGHIPVPAVRFEKVQNDNGDEVTLKCFQFDRFAEITGREEEFSEIFDIIDFPRSQTVLGKVHDDEKREEIVNGFVQCELKGLLKQPGR